MATLSITTEHPKVIRQVVATDPDVQEFTEWIAEKVRVLLVEDDETQDRLDDVTFTLFGDEVLEDSNTGEDEVDLLDKAYTVVMREVKKKLGPMFIRILKTDDWRDPRGQTD